MTYTITANKDFNSLEVKFDGKPSDAIRDALKSLKFRWHGVKKIWYGYKTEEEVKTAIDAAEKGHTIPENNEQEKATQNHIRIYYNGIKIDGGDLIRCFYSLNNNKDGAPSVSISARDYSRLPSDLFEVHNETDLYTDYFDSDRAYLTPEHPLFKYFYYAGAKQETKSLKKHIEYLEKNLAGRETYKGQHEYYKIQLENDKKRIAEFEKMTDPGQPTQNDLDKIDAIRQQEENDRIAAEHEQELKEREKILNDRVNGLRFIAEQTEKYPVEENAPVVLVNWSEHVALGEFEENTLKLSLTAAENIFKTFDEQIHQEKRGYDKTSFVITWTDENGEPFTYEGRYDLGDNDGGLIQHIRIIGEWDLTHEYNGALKKVPDETNDRIKIADYLSKFVKNPA